MEEAKLNKIAYSAFIAYRLEAFLAKAILLYLIYMTPITSGWPHWFKLSISLIIVLSFFVRIVEALIMGLLLELGRHDNILDQFANNLPYSIRLAFIALSITWVICVMISFKRKLKKIDKDENPINDLMNDKKWNKGYYDSSAGEK